MTAEREALSVERQCALFGCDLIDLLRREGAHSGVWFAEHLLQAADLLERQALANPATIRDTDEDAEWLRSVAQWGNLRINDERAARLERIANRLASSTPAEPDEPTEAMIEAGREGAFNQAHRTYGDMCRAIYRAMSQRKAEPDVEGGEA